MFQGGCDDGDNLTDTKNIIWDHQMQDMLKDSKLMYL